MLTADRNVHDPALMTDSALIGFDRIASFGYDEPSRIGEFVFSRETLSAEVACSSV
ncbi:MAG: hypothetical protein AAGB04_24925 [Pseudomonadota bacterium]